MGTAHQHMSIDKAMLAEEMNFLQRVPKSMEMHRRAIKSIPGGVSSSWASARPAPVWISHGEGPYVFDVDGNRYIDFHAGYGANVVGHAHPAIVKAVQDRVTKGTHFAQPTADCIVVAEELSRRFGLPKWRFGNSGTESTMDAVHIMRSFTKRDIIVKIEGCYNGHHDSVMVSINRSLKDLGPASDPLRVPSAGIPKAVAENVRIVPYNDLEALERVFAQNKGKIAGMILEPMMMNAGIIPPKAGYLEGIREITKRNGALLTFDEVKTGLVVGPGGVTRLFGVQPDLVCLAKALGGGLPCGAIGGTHEVMAIIESGQYAQVGTFNGNPMTMAAAKATLLEVLTDEAYAQANDVGQHILQKSLAVLAEHKQPAHGVAMGFKVAILFHGRPCKTYREFLEIDTAASHYHFLRQFNGGVFLPPWGKSESLTLSVAHRREHGDVYVNNLAGVARSLAMVKDRTSKVCPAGSFDMDTTGDESQDAAAVPMLAFG